MSLRKNRAGQIVAFTAVDADGDYVTGDAANISASVIVDGVRQAATNAVAEIDATNAPGRYRLELTQAETNADSVEVAAVSSTTDVQVLAPALGPTLQDPTAAENAAAVAAQVNVVPLLGPFTATGTPTTTSIACTVDTADAAAADYAPGEANRLAGMFVIVRSGEQTAQMRRIAASSVNGATLTITVDAFAEALATGDTFSIGGLA